MSHILFFVNSFHGRLSENKWKLAAESKTKPATKQSPDPAQAFSHPDTLLSHSLSPPLISGLH